jgi:hypothetical protein
MTIKTLNKDTLTYKFKAEDFLNNIIIELEKELGEGVPYNKEMLFALVEQKKPILNHFYHINVQKKTNNFINFILAWDFGIEDGIQTVKGVIKKILNDFEQHMLAAKNYPETIFVSVDPVSETPLLLIEHSIDNQFTKYGFEAESLKNISVEDAVKSKTHKLLDTPELNVLTYAFKVFEIYTEVENSGYAYGNYDAALELIESTTGIQSVEKTDIFNSEGAYDMAFAFIARRPSNDDIEKIIKDIRSLGFL